MIRTRDTDAKAKEATKKNKIVTTRDINVILDEGPKKLKIETTKNIEVKYIDTDAPHEGPKGPMVTTHNVEEFQKKAKKKPAKKKAVVKKE